MSQQSSRKIAAIYDLREAAEAKANAENAVEIDPTPNSRDALLDAQIELEAKTADAVDACHDCDDTSHDHAPKVASGSGTPAASRKRTNQDDNVIEVDFAAGARSA